MVFLGKNQSKIEIIEMKWIRNVRWITKVFFRDAKTGFVHISVNIFKLLFISYVYFIYICMDIQKGRKALGLISVGILYFMHAIYMNCILPVISMHDMLHVHNKFINS